MKKIKSIQLKAAFLALVFSLNTIIGFACAIGVNMGFNSHHHEEEELTVAQTSHHHDKLQHHHDEVAKDHQSKDKDDCCNDKVMKIVQLDKAVPQSFSIAINSIFFTAFISSFYNIDLLYSSREDASIKYFVRSHHPPIPDIRIAIQSFQI